MPELPLDTTLLCAYCGKSARFISVNSKQPRCEYRISHCSEITTRAQQTRTNNWTKLEPNALSKHMSELSAKGNKALLDLSKDSIWVENKSKAIKAAIKQRGGNYGSKNPMYGKQHTSDAKLKMIESAGNRDNSNIGRYNRTESHRQILRESMYKKLDSGKMFCVHDTKPELRFAAYLDYANIEYTKQFVIQFGKIGIDRFRHAYDFHLTDTNIIVEIDGEYWHTKPEVVKRDIKCEAVANERGYHVIRIRDSDLEDSIQKLTTMMDV